MNELKALIIANPQVSAAIITAVCGILGIFINILINMRFRKQDYKNRNKMKQIENMELYYLPLCDKSENIIKLINKLNKNSETNLHYILDGEMGASYAQDVKMLKEQLRELTNHFVSGSYKYQDNYKLFKIHRTVKYNVCELYQYSEKNVKNSEESNINELLQELEELVYRIRMSEVSIMTDNFLSKIVECFIIWRNYYKKKKSKL